MEKLDSVERQYSLYSITNTKKNLKRAWNGERVDGKQLDPEHSIIFHIQIQDNKDDPLYWMEYRITRFTGTTLNLRCHHDNSSRITPCMARLVIEYGEIPVKDFSTDPDKRKWDFDTKDQSIIRNVALWGPVKHK